VEFRTEITNFKNRYPPEFPESVYEIELPMPLAAGYTIVGDCGTVIEVTDYDYHNLYQSDVIFSLKDPTADLEVSGLKIDGKKWAVTLKTTSTFRIEEPLTVTLVAHDVPPQGNTDPELTSEVNITIIPDIAASTPASPLFADPIYIFDIKEETDIEPKEATLLEGATEDYEVELSYLHGENLEGFFDIVKEGAVITLTPNKSLASTEFGDNFGILILEAKHPNTSRIGKTVIHVTLPQDYVTPPPTTTETTMLPCSCPTEETTYTAATTETTVEITQCPEVTNPTEVTCPDVTCPEVTCPEVTGTGVTCPEVTGTDVTCPDVTCATEPTILPCTCTTEETTLTSDTTKTTEETTFITDITKPTEESTHFPEVTGSTEVTCEPETTIPSCECSCPPPTTYCPTEELSTTSPTASDISSTTTTTVNTTTREPCDCTPGLGHQILLQLLHRRKVSISLTPRPQLIFTLNRWAT